MSSIGKGQHVASEDVLTASDWEARLDEARARRAEVLADRKQIPNAPFKPWLEPGVETLSKHYTEDLIDEANDGAVAKYRRDEPGISRFAERVEILKPDTDHTDQAQTERLSFASVAAAEQQRKASRRDLLPELEPVVVSSDRSDIAKFGRVSGLGFLSSSLKCGALAALLVVLPRAIGDAAVPLDLKLLSAPPSVTVPLVSESAAKGPKAGSFERQGFLELRSASLPRTQFPPFVGPVGTFPLQMRADALDLNRTDPSRVVVSTDIARLSYTLFETGTLDAQWAFESDDVIFAAATSLGSHNAPDAAAVVPENPSFEVVVLRDYAWSNGGLLVSGQDVAPILAPLPQSVRPHPAPDWSAPVWNAEYASVITVSPTIRERATGDLSTR